MSAYSATSSITSDFGNLRLGYNHHGSGSSNGSAGRRNRPPPPHIAQPGQVQHPRSRHVPGAGFPLPSPSTYASTARGARQIRSPRAKDIEQWQFWPHAMGMGSATGKDFTQMFGSNCKQGEDPNHNMGYGYSFLAFNFKKESLLIKADFDVSGPPLPLAFRPLDAELPFADISTHGIRAIEELRRDGRITLTVTVTCRRPPRFFATFENTPGQRAARVVYRRRATAMDFVTSSVKEIHAGVLRPVPEEAVANVSKPELSYLTTKPTFWNTYRWTFNFSPSELDLFRKCANKLRMLSVDNPDMDLMSESNRRLAMRRQSAWNFPDLTGLDFGTRALIEGLVGNGIILPGDTKELVTALRQHAKAAVFRHHLLETLFTEERIRNISNMIEGRARFLRRTETVRNLEHLVRIRTVQVTPTRVLVGPPQHETSNSVTRRYADKLDAIIRVQFVDEGDRLHIMDYTKKGDERCPEVGLMARIRRALQHGVMIAGRRFYPVASSSSQQKEHSMWFVNHEVIDRIELAKWMGMPSEKVVAKYAARMGLPFSASRSVNTKFNITRWPDIERLGACFTDGCSVAGSAVLMEAAKVLGQKGLNLKPSAVQFRLGGAKGVLACWPDLVAENEIRLRPSQEKFSSPLTDLNVIRVAHYQVGFLNRQFIMIMSALGVPDSLFMELFEKEVKDIRGLTQRAEQGTTTVKDFAFMNIYTSFQLGQLIKNGYNQNPFILDMCHLIECRALQDLKWRARIRLPDSVYLIGINDESGTLKEGELFCQYQKDENTKPEIVTGRVLICRAPALHPGDVRHAVAVDNPRLHHLKNCIVFSTQGPRPLPNMLGGGDLDGDDYTLIWDQRFVRPLKEYEPMDYTAPKPVTVEKVTQRDLNENFVQYILNDVLGQVDNAHLGNADYTSPFNPICMKLSIVHSAAVDFAKTGVAVDVEREWLPLKWPDFMGKDEEKTYQSAKILGQLFRYVDTPPMFDPVNICEQEYPFDPRFSTYNIRQDIIDVLTPIKIAFEQGMTYTMRRYRVRECEVVAGIAVQTKQRKRSRELSHLHEPLKDAFEGHVAKTREAALAAATDLATRVGIRFRSTVHVIAVHAYVMTYKQQYVEDYEASLLLYGPSAIGFGNNGDTAEQDLHPSPMLSFAWVWALELNDFAMAAARGSV